VKKVVLASTVRSEARLPDGIGRRSCRKRKKSLVYLNFNWEGTVRGRIDDVETETHKQVIACQLVFREKKDQLGMRILCSWGDQEKMGGKESEKRVSSQKGERLAIEGTEPVVGHIITSLPDHLKKRLESTTIKHDRGGS